MENEKIIQSVFSKEKQLNKMENESKSDKNSEMDQVDKFDDCLKIFEIFGLQFFNTADLKNENCCKENPSKRRSFYMIFILCSLTALVGVFFVFGEDVVDDDEKVTMNNVIMVAIEGLMSAMFIAIIVVTIIESFVQSKRWKKFHKKNIKLLKEMNQMGYDDVFGDFSKRSRRNTLIAIFSFLVIHISVGIVELNTDYVQMIAITIFATLPMLFTLILTIRIILYVSMINQLLVKLTTIFKNQFTLTTKTKNENALSPVQTHMEPVKSLLVIRHCYNLILENTNTLDDIWGLSLLCYSIAYVVTLTVSVYVFCVEWVDGLSFDEFIGDKNLIKSFITNSEI